MTARPTIDAEPFGKWWCANPNPNRWFVIWYRDCRTIMGWRRCWVRRATFGEIRADLKDRNLLHQRWPGYDHAQSSTAPINQSYVRIHGLPGVRFVRLQKLHRKAISFDDWFRLTAWPGSDRDARGMPVQPVKAKSERPPTLVG